MHITNILKKGVEKNIKIYTFWITRKKKFNYDHKNTKLWSKYPFSLFFRPIPLAEWRIIILCTKSLRKNAYFSISIFLSIDFHVENSISSSESLLWNLRFSENIYLFFLLYLISSCCSEYKIRFLLPLAIELAEKGE